MIKEIRKAAVIGAGTMGSGIAALLTAVGIETALFDIPPDDTKPGDDPERRNAIVLAGLNRLRNSRPIQPYIMEDVDVIRIGNLEDDLAMLKDVDWVVEAVVEKLDVKQALMVKLHKAVSPDTIISTNTSGLPLKAIAQHMPSDFTRRFIGTHFFNPPRYLYLLEIIPHANTNPEVVDFMIGFGSHFLGKGVVLCKDTPNFIANRISIFGGSFIRNYMLDHGLMIEEVDALTGPLIGRPKTATFRLQDLVGLDTSRFVIENLYPMVEDDPAREVLTHKKTSALARRMMESNRLGNKTGQGFYKQFRGPDGQREFQVLDLHTFEYRASIPPAFESVEKHKDIPDIGERIRHLIHEEDRAGRFLWHLHAFDLAYASNRIPEVTDTIVNLDNAVRWGFNRELGPFEIWDAIGIQQTIPQFEEAGYPVAAWVKEMLALGIRTFYQRNQAGQATGYYSPEERAYVPIIRDRLEVTTRQLRASGAQIATNESASLFDMGDSVLLLDLHSQNSYLNALSFDMVKHAVNLLDKRFDALVIGTSGSDFALGLNPSPLVREGLDFVSAVQGALKALRQTAKPVIAAPSGNTLDTGAVLALSATQIVTHIEASFGFSEIKLGMIPAFGGCAALIRRIINPAAGRDSSELAHVLQNVFRMILLAQISTNAREARKMDLISEADKIVMNRRFLLGEAKEAALAALTNPTEKGENQIWAAGQHAYNALMAAAAALRESEQLKDYDVFIADKLAMILSGGAPETPGWVEEDIILELEVETLKQLLQEDETRMRLERIAARAR